MFDTIEELLTKIRLGEDSVLELKVVEFRGDKIIGPFRNELADELAAFANSNDGVLLLGVDDRTKEIIGIPIERLDQTETYVREICNDSANPPISARILRIELPDARGEKRPVIKVEIPRSLFVHESPGGYFRRLGSSKRKLPPDLLARLFQQRSQVRIIRFDEQPVPDTDLSSLDEYLWRRLIPKSERDPVLALRKMLLITQDDTGSERGSVGGILMCCEHPERILTNAFIEAVRYRGVKQDSNYQAAAAKITGPLDRQIQHAMSFVRVNMKVGALKRPGRIEFPQFSLRAVFEAVVNAVAHRDYSIHGSKIRLFMYDDRLELFSPGALPNTLTIESLPLRQATRNDLITSLLARCPTDEYDTDLGRQYLMDRRGEGVPVILEESEKLSGKLPVYRVIDDTELLLTIFSAKLPNQKDFFRQGLDEDMVSLQSGKP